MVSIPTKTKFNAVKVVYDGRKFDSKLECNIYKVLKERLVPYGFHIGFQPLFILQDKFKFEGHIIRPITYKADFLIYKGSPDTDIGVFNKYAIIDAKGMETPEFKLKRKLFIKIYGYDIVILKSMKQANLWCDNFLSRYS
jgi:hypothetical protein